MLIGFVSLVVLIALLLGLSVFLLVEPRRIPAKSKTMILSSTLLVIVVVFYAVGPAKIKNDLARVVRNSKPNLTRKSME